MNRLTKRVSAFVLALCTMFSSATLSYAQGTETKAIPETTLTATDNVEKLPVSKDTIPEGLDVKSLIADGFTTRVKGAEQSLGEVIFENEEGIRSLYIFDEDVKFRDENGNVKDKSNKVVVKDRTFVSESNDIEVVLPANITGGISLKDKDLNITMRPTSVLGTSRLASAGQIKDEKSVLYEDVFDDYTDVKYTFTYSGVKEDIILEKYNGVSSFNYEVSTGGLSLNEEKGALVLRDNNGEAKAVIGEIVVFSADNKNNTFGEYTVKEKVKNSLYTVTISVDEEYLTSPDTTYPVTIDPTVGTVSTSSNIQDMQVFKGTDGSGNTETSAGLSGVSRVGWTDWGACRTLMKLTSETFINEVQAPEQIIGAYVELRDLMCQGVSLPVSCSQFTGSDWEETDTKTWNQLNAGNSSASMITVEVSYEEGVDSVHWYQWNIKSIAKGWVTNSANRDKGIVFKTATDFLEGSSNYSQCMKTFSSMQGNTAYKPHIRIDYKYRAIYNVTTELSPEDQAVATETVGLLGNMEYPTCYAELPTFNDIKETSDSASILIIHGHGTAGAIYLRSEASLNSTVTVYSGALENIPQSTWSHIKFVFFATCQSGKALGSTKSMVDKAYELGADYVIGFNDNVTGAEDFLNYMIEHIESSDASVTLREAKEYALGCYDDKSDPSCPANTDNLCWRGTGLEFIK